MDNLYISSTQSIKYGEITTTAVLATQYWERQSMRKYKQEQERKVESVYRTDEHIGKHLDVIV